MDFLPTADDVSAKIEQLRTLGTQFENTLTRLVGLENAARLDETAWANWNALVNEGLAGRSTIQKGVQAIQDATAWLRDTFGLSGMGFAPLLIGVALAAIVAAISFASGWLSRADPEIRRLEILQATVANLPADQQAKILSDAAKRQPTTWTGNLANMALYLALGAAAIFVLPKLLNKSGG